MRETLTHRLWTVLRHRRHCQRAATGIPPLTSIQTLIQEIDHARAFVLCVEALRLVVERCWRAETDCDLAALVDVRVRLESEKERAGVIVSAGPAQREQRGLPECSGC